MDLTFVLYLFFFLSFFEFFMIFLLLFVDIDECLGNPCHPNASCSDNQGSYDCQCNSGYSGNGFTCTGKQVYIKNKGIDISTKMDILNKNDVFC